MLGRISRRSLKTTIEFNITRRMMASSTNKNIAVVLAGSGVYDGSEVHEASAVMVNLSRNNAEYKCFAPNIPQVHVIDHTTGEEMNEARNVLIEAARIARGKIEALDLLNVSEFDAVIFPGGFGAAKNLCDFAVKGADMTINEQVLKVLSDFHSNKKPIGMCCISPVILAKAFPGCELTLGMDTEQDGRFPYAGASGAATQMGAKHINKEVHEIHVDDENRLVTTPAFMCETKVHEIHDGVGKMVKALLNMSA